MKILCEKNTAVTIMYTCKGVMEALEGLLKSGYKFRRSFYIAFGHDSKA